jgi:uncharacterized membrane protein
LTPSPGAREGAHRVIFIDLARALAVVMMVYGHTVSALLGAEYRAGPWFDAWTFQRGLTSSLFMLLAGFAFSIATTRHWSTHMQLSAALWKRLRRFGLFILLGYALHFPVSRLWHLYGTSEERWRSLLQVDVLQLIGVTFIAVQLLVLTVRSRRAFMAAALLLAAAIVAATPAVWSIDWERRLPFAIAAYLMPPPASQFPLFPWAAFVLIGAGTGQIYARWGAGHLSAFANGFIMTGAALAAITLLPLFGKDPLGWVPLLVVLRTGICLVLLGLIAHASRFITRLPHVFGAVAQESLLIYFIHLCIVYGSVWNMGLAQLWGETLSPAATALVVAAMLAAMIVLAWQWNRLKHVTPQTARRVSIAAGVLLVGMLLFPNG